MGRHASLARICVLASRLERMEQAAGIGTCLILRGRC